ncbi:hypothetical protein LM599_00785 [Candidatus Acetothermia bacterium]|nr:hypothetical protein [Candidatus Acetothermia bacterium]MCI2427398.1 hypothetical protein [Candidatus Acetothermia bacterium]MCI2428553.1 hypothetical protein [Candidatus Acetothermia bacterium]
MKFGCTDRISKLRDDLVSKACYGGKYEDGIFVDLSRAKLYMDSYKETEGCEPLIRRAKAQAHVLKNISIAILPNELIVGNPHADPHALSIFPEINCNLLREAIADGYVREQDREIAEELLQYWAGRNIADKVAENMSDWIKKIVSASSSFISTTWQDGIQHCIPNWDYVFEHGTSKIREKINAKLDEIKEQIGQQASSKLINARYLYEAMLLALDGLNAYVERFHTLALETAQSNILCREEMLQIAEILKSALKEPPKSLWEACQGFFFLHLIFTCIDSAAFGSLVRIDQSLWPFYKKDVIDEGKITREQAQELIEALMLKVQALGAFFSRKRRLHFEGNGALPIWSLGGVKSDGTDACNELTDLILQAAQSVRLNQPTISFMYHEKMRDSSLVEAIKTIRTGLGYPSFTNGDWMVQSLIRQGIPIEAARNSGVVGCVSCCPVDSCNTTKRLALTVIAAKSMELALNEGNCLVTGEKIGPDERPASEFKSYEDVISAVRKQLTFAVKTAVNVRNLARHYEKIYRPNPLVSALHRSPLETGIDAVTYEDYPNNCWLNMVGVINVVNSLAVIKKLAFEEKKYTLTEITAAIKSNWEGKEAMRQECINKVPKFGNDDHYVDEIAREIFKMCSDIAANTFDINGHFWSIVAQSVSIYQATAGMIGALPDGKLAGKPVADGGISPDHGTDRNGIFPVLSSVSTVDHFRTKGLLLNQWIAPELLEGEQGIAWMKAILKMWNRKGLSQIQFNVVDPNLLRDAQKNPAKYPNLTIRVSGYTANWVKLTSELQEIILSRTLQRG